MEQVIADDKPRRTSYSACNTLQGCERQYFLKYIAKAPKDADATESDALCFGKAVHQLLEICRWDWKTLKPGGHIETFQEFLPQADERTFKKVMACFIVGSELHLKSKLQWVASETEIGGEDFVGYVDLIVKDDYGNWRIVDLKTAAKFDDKLICRLHADPQLNFYAYFVDEIARKLGLDPKKFTSVHYRVVVKPSLVPQKEENPRDYGKRASEAYDVIVPAKMLDPEAAFQKMLRLRKRTQELTAENAECNRQNCFSFFRPCDFWSQCHGKLFTESRENLMVFTTKTMVDLTEKTVADTSEDLLM